MMQPSEAARIAEVLRQVDPDTAESVIAELDQAVQQEVRRCLYEPDSVPPCSGNAQATSSLVTLLEAAIGDGPHMSPSNPPLLGEIPDPDLLTVLRNEYPQVAAVCLARIEPDRATQLLAQLEERLRVELISRLRELAGLDPQLIEDIHAEACRYRSQSESVQGVAEARAIVDRIPDELRQELWNSLAPGRSTNSASGTVEDLSGDFIRQLEADAALASLEFNRLCHEQWAALEAVVECVPVTALHDACQGLDPKVRQLVIGRLPGSLQTQIRESTSSRLPLTVNQIHVAQVELLRAAIESDSYQFSVWHRKKHISVAA